MRSRGIEIDKPLSRERRIETMAFYAVLAWQKERGRPSLFPATGDYLDALPDVPPLDEAMAGLEKLFRTEPR